MGDGMTMFGRTVLLAGTAVLAACGNASSHREWSAKDGETAQIAYDECDEQVDTTMRLRGYPVNPLPETPQFQYRQAVFAQCMRRKGYETD